MNFVRLLRALCFVALIIPVSSHAMTLPDFTRLVEKYSPAVVNISTTQAAMTGIPRNFSIPGLPDNHQFGEMLKKFFEQQQQFGRPDSFNEQSLGSGFIVSADGYVLTNAHVVADAEEILVRLYDRRELPAEVIGMDEQSDIALLKIAASNLPVVKLGSSRDLKVGEWVMAIGNPFGFDHSVTAGIVSAKGRSFHNENYVPFIQTDVAINPGNSGGPLFNIKGEVIGINSRISSEPGRRSYAGLSFAIPADIAKDVMQQLKQHGQVSRGWLGVLIQDVTTDLSKSFGLDKPKGALVAKVLQDSPALQGGVKVGDVILKFNDNDINTSSALPPLVGSLRAGETVHLGLMRDGKHKKLTIKIGELPQEIPTAGSSKRNEQSSVIERLGLQLRDLDDQTKEETGIGYGVLVTRVSKGPAEEIGLREGDVIQLIDNQTINNIAGMQKIIDSLKSGRSVAILVLRGSGPVFLAMRVP